MTDEKLNELLGTNPAYLKAEDFRGLSDSDLARVVPRLLPSTLARLRRMLSASPPEWVNQILGEVPTLPKPYTAILSAIQSEGCSLDMGSWHSCKTTHCLAGWTVHLAGKAGYALERKVYSTPAAAALILRKSRPEAPLPNFYATNEQALAFIKARAAEEV